MMFILFKSLFYYFLIEIILLEPARWKPDFSSVTSRPIKLVNTIGVTIEATLSLMFLKSPFNKGSPL